MMDSHDPRTSVEFLDPERGDPGYWHRFRHRVLVVAGPELTRRRARTSVTVSDVVLGWRNALVPTAIIAAAVAGMLLLQERPLAPPSSTIDDLVSGLEEPIPVFLASSLTDEGVRLSLEESF